MTGRPDDTFQFTRELPDGTLVRLNHAHERVYLSIRPKGSRSWCTAPVDLASGQAIAGRWALMNSNERAARAAKRAEG